MQIRCVDSKRFLCSIEIEKYYENYKKLGISIETPIRVEIPCANCRVVEVYDIFPNTYNLVEKYKYGCKK